ncbi:NAD-dependent epimerase/dehydratase family protein [Cellvibrio japonicus]|uniref:NAD dependent epimerase/dehydratase-like protein n=1 Tax=Cellvibrio japonicus (strain Ueda107) TaxID=498211 RepID=B3PG02_CELJU|nr:NAD-dependent epimerase/dehydratase family protein [Cellvibrio japonicus]ACE85350.1 NAD dependent epimerase/dehydratase-like protein [Cellvibrio japonicus Ueda107]QEI13689.1 NAD-dependent epimerase/dehydratase family protein [Cellvibrio japonicus]QEI17263.1 NAD-dependent epimerase/dehydratase family protein [Cellvibrio japonicus]QEI20840.1 NAD-dependent epimerase/dehydratase family protein [Cellvibrio japonicus]
MNVLVTGANGYLGQALCPYLVASGYHLVTLTRQPYGLQGTVNIPVPDYLVSLPEQAFVGQEVVIHLAARAHQPGSASKRIDEEYRRINVDTTLAIAHAALRAGARRFIFLSSIKVNGEVTTGLPFRSSDPPKPGDAYGRSKWQAEQALTALFDKTGTELVIVRPPLIWGGAPKGNLATLVRLIDLKIPLPFKSLRNRRDLVSLGNLCSLIRCCLDHPAAAGQTLLVSDARPRSTAEIIWLISSQAKFSPRLVAFPTSLLRLLRHVPVIGTKLDKLISNLEVDIGQTQTLLGWQPEMD